MKIKNLAKDYHKSFHFVVSSLSRSKKKIKKEGKSCGKKEKFSFLQNLLKLHKKNDAA